MRDSATEAGHLPIICLSTTANDLMSKPAYGIVPRGQAVERAAGLATIINGAMVAAISSRFLGERHA